MIITNNNDVRIFFEGNSLTALSSNSDVVGDQHVARTAYETIIQSKSKIAMFSFAVSGRTQTLINASFSTNISPMLRPNDIVFNWEGTNDLSVNALSASAAFANLVTHCNNVKAIGGRFVVGTVAARDYAGDAGDLMTRIDAYNVLVRANSSTYGYTICDIAANANFATRAATANTTYYKADKLHMTTAGQDLVASLISTSLLTIL